MDDREFFDLLYQLWSKTTGAKDRYWMPEAVEPPSLCETETGLEDTVIWAVGEDQQKKLVASHLIDEDADFITAIHGCLPDLVRRLHAALDEADRLDTYVDEQEGHIAELEIEATKLEAKQARLHAELESARADVEYWRSR